MRKNQNKNSRGRDAFKKYKGILLFLTKCIRLFPKRIRTKILEAFRGIKGKKGIALRYAALCAVAQSIGDNVAILEDVYFINPEQLVIGSNVSIHPQCYLHCYGGIMIGNDVSIAQGTTLVSMNHIYSSNDLPIRDQGVEKKPIVLGNDIWIGAKCVILGNVQIFDGAVVGAAAVVTKNVEANKVVVGNPARVIKTR